MKVIPIALQQEFQKGAVALASLFYLKRRDGKVFAYTDADTDITMEGVTYKAFAGVLPSAVESTGQMNVDNLNMKGLLTADGVQAWELEAGLFHGAEVSLYIVARNNPSAGYLELRSGWLGEVSFSHGTFDAELRGLLQAFKQALVEATSKQCRAMVGDRRCKLDMTPFTHERVIKSVDAYQRVIEVEGETFPDGYFNKGLLEPVGGQAIGVRMEVSRSTGTELHLLLPSPMPLSIGDMVKLTAGCDGELKTCKTRFNNVLNFRGEPFIPDISALIPGAQDDTDKLRMV